jgi:hypothetical protein
MKIYITQINIKLVRHFLSLFSQSNISINPGVTKRTRCDLGPVPLEDQTWARKVNQLDCLNRTLLKNNAWRSGWGRNGNFVHGGTTIAPESAKTESRNILSQTSAKPRGFRVNMRKLKMNQPLSDEDKESVQNVFSVFIQHMIVSPGSSRSQVPHIKVDSSKAQELMESLKAIAKSELDER